MKRRQFLKVAGAGGAASVIAAPAIAQSMPEVKWRVTSSFPKSLDTIYGASEVLSKAVSEATDGKFQIQVFAAGEIVPALERGVIDAAEWVGPLQDRRLGLHKAAKNYYNTGWHEPSTTTELLISKKAFNALPKDIQGIVRHVAAAANIIAHTSAEALNGGALEDLVKNYGVKVSELPTEVIEELRKKTAEVLEAGAAANPMTRKVHDSFMSFKKKHDKWANSSNRQFAIRVRGG